jgi:hypothetical protein
MIVYPAPIWLPLWGWILTGTLAGYGVGVLQVFLWHRRGERGHVFCPRCTHYLTWRDSFVRELKKKARQKVLKSREPW